MKDKKRDLLLDNLSKYLELDYFKMYSMMIRHADKGDKLISRAKARWVVSRFGIKREFRDKVIDDMIYLEMIEVLHKRAMLIKPLKDQEENTMRMLD